MYDDQPDIAERVDERTRTAAPAVADDRCRRSPGRRCACQVEADAVQRDRGRQRRPRHHVADRCLPGRLVERRAAADQEGEGQQQPRRHHAPGKAQTASATETTSMKACAVSITMRRSKLSAMAPAPAAKQHDRQRDRRLHQRDHVGRVRRSTVISHAAPTRLDQAAEIREQGLANPTRRGKRRGRNGASDDEKEKSGGLFFTGFLFVIETCDSLPGFLRAVSAQLMPGRKQPHPQASVHPAPRMPDRCYASHASKCDWSRRVDLPAWQIQL